MAITKEVRNMNCLRCGSAQLNKIMGLYLGLSGVERQKDVGVTGIHCGSCGFLTLEMNPAAAPVEATEPTGLAKY